MDGSQIRISLKNLIERYGICIDHYNIYYYYFYTFLQLFLGLGLTVGGISNFPNDKIVGQRKSVYKFIESHKRMDNPWPKPSLLIDYVKVFSESH